MQNRKQNIKCNNKNYYNNIFFLIFCGFTIKKYFCGIFYLIGKCLHH